METFTVRVVAAEQLDDINTFVVVLAEDKSGGDRLEIQRSLSFDSQDKEQGMDTYCICLPSGACHYGGVLSCEIDQGILQIDLDADASDDLGTDRFQLKLKLQPEEIEQLREGLNRVFGTDRPSRWAV